MKLNQEIKELVKVASTILVMVFMLVFSSIALDYRWKTLHAVEECREYAELYFMQYKLTDYNGCLIEYNGVLLPLKDVKELQKIKAM